MSVKTNQIQEPLPRSDRRPAVRLASVLCGGLTVLLTLAELASRALMFGWQGKTVSAALVHGWFHVWRWDATYPSGLIIDGAGASMAGWYFPKAVAAPLWPLALTGLVATIVLWRRSRRPPPGHCGVCGYDLTGNTSGRCPECGTVMPATDVISASKE